MSKISGEFQISGQFQDTFEISGTSGISGQLGPLRWFSLLPLRVHQTIKSLKGRQAKTS